MIEVMVQGTRRYGIPFTTTATSTFESAVMVTRTTSSIITDEIFVGNTGWYIIIAAVTMFAMCLLGILLMTLGNIRNRPRHPTPAT